MKSTKTSPPLSPSMVEDATAERLKKRLRDAGLIVNAGAGKMPKPSRPAAKAAKKSGAR